jgi:hypothetical protein
MLKSAVIQTALAGEAIVNAVIGNVGGGEHEEQQVSHVLSVGLRLEIRCLAGLH